MCAWSHPSGSAEILLHHIFFLFLPLFWLLPILILHYIQMFSSSLTFSPSSSHTMLTVISCPFLCIQLYIILPYSQPNFWKTCLLSLLYFPFPVEPTVKWLLYSQQYINMIGLHVKCLFLPSPMAISDSSNWFLWKPHTSGLSLYPILFILS